MKTRSKSHKLRHVVAVSNYKGGIGKTSTVMNLAAAIAQRIENYRVLVIDIDSSCSLSKLIGWDMKRELDGEPTLFTSLSNPAVGLPVYPTKRDNLYLCPSSVNISGIDAILAAREDPNTALKDVLDRPLNIRVDEDDELADAANNHPTLSETFDFVFIDAQPSVTRMNFNALYAADGCIVPTELEEESITRMGQLVVAAGSIAQKTGRLSIHGILISNYIANRRTTKYYEPQIRKISETFKTAIRNSKDIDESRSLHEDVFMSYSGGRAAEDYTALANEYLKKFG